MGVVNTLESEQTEFTRLFKELCEYVGKIYNPDAPQDNSISSNLAEINESIHRITDNLLPSLAHDADLNSNQYREFFVYYLIAQYILNHNIQENYSTTFTEFNDSQSQLLDKHAGDLKITLIGGIIFITIREKSELAKMLNITGVKTKLGNIPIIVESLDNIELGAKIVSHEKWHVVQQIVSEKISGIRTGLNKVPLASSQNIYYM